MQSSATSNFPSALRVVPVLGIACLVVVASLLFLPPLADAFRIKNHVVSLAGYGLFLLYLACAPATTARLPLLVRLALIACLTTIVISSLAALHPIIAWQAGLELLPLGLIFWLLVQQQDCASIARVLEKAWVFAGILVAVVALLQAVMPQWLDIGLVAADKLAAFSTLGNPIWASLLLVVALPLAVQGARQGPRLLWCGPLIVLAALWATQSRQAWLAVVCMGWTAVVWKGGQRPRKLALAALLLLLCALPFVDFSANMFHSLQGRLLIMRGAWQMFWDHPLTGVGLGHLGAAYPRYQAALLADPGWRSYAGHAAVTDDAHNEFLQWAATTGALGLAGFTLLCASVLWLGWRSAYVRVNLWHWYLGYAGLLVTLLFTGIQAQSALGLLLVSCLAVVLAGANQSAVRVRSSRSMTLVCGAVLLALALAAAQWALRDVRADYWEGQGDRVMQERDAWLAQQGFEQALALDADRSGVLKKHASILYLDGRYADALADLARAKSLSGDTGIAMLEAEILAKTGQDVQAISAYQAIAASFPQLLSPQFILGQLYSRQHQPALARAAFQRVVDMAPSPFNQQLTQEKVLQQKQMAAAFIARLDRQQ